MPPKKVKRVARKKTVKKSSPVTPAKKKTLSNPFNTIQSDFTPPGKFILVYGEPGRYKTTTMAHAPNTLFVTTSDEKGILEAVQAEVVPPDIRDNIVVLEPLADPDSIPSSGGHPAWLTLMKTLDLFVGGDHDRDSLVIDTASGLQPICHQHCASMMYDGDMNNPKGFMNYQEGYLKAAEQFWNGEFLSRCNKVTATGRNIILICHSTLQKVPNFEGTDYECYAPALIKGAKKDNIYDYTMKTASAVLFFGVAAVLTTDEKKKKKISSEHGFIGVQDQGWYKAKNWYNLKDEIPIGGSAEETWNSIESVLPFISIPF